MYFNHIACYQSSVKTNFLFERLIYFICKNHTLNVQEFDFLRAL